MKEGLLSVRDGGEGDLSYDTGDGGGRLSHDELVCEGVVSLGELGDAEVPGCAIGIGKFDDGVNSSGITFGPLCRGDDGWSEALEFPVTDFGPDILDFGGQDCGLCIGAGAGDG